MENEEFYVLQVEVEDYNMLRHIFEKNLNYVTEAKLTKDGYVSYKTSNSKENAYHFTRKYLRILTMADSEFANKINVYQGNTSYKELDRIADSNNALIGNYFNL